MNCNCPCYIPRPKLRFTIRIAFHLFFILLRIAALIIYGVGWSAEAPGTDRDTWRLLMIITGASLLFPFLSVLLDIYHYRVWWAYEPEIDVAVDILKKPLSPKHKRFIPYVLLERFRTARLGNRKCKNGRSCVSEELDHVVIFHSTDHQPQPRWSSSCKNYIGFHRTTPQAAVSIARSEFSPSKSGMLGPGAYFARSTDATTGKIGKSDQTGAWFVAEISMGRVFQVDVGLIRDHRSPHFKPELRKFVEQGRWHEEYDTCYFNHAKDSLDEFCVKDTSKRILRWVVVIEPPHDKKLSAYGLDNELNSDFLGCC